MSDKHEKFKTLLKITGVIVVGSVLFNTLTPEQEASSPKSAAVGAHQQLPSSISKTNFMYPLARVSVKDNQICYATTGDSQQQVACDTTDHSWVELNNDITTATSCITNLGFAKELESVHLSIMVPQLPKTAMPSFAEAIVKRMPVEGKPENKVLDDLDGGAEQMDFMRRTLPSADYELLNKAWKDYQLMQKEGSSKDLVRRQYSSFQIYLTESDVQKNNLDAWERIDTVRSKEQNRQDIINTVFNNFSYTLLSDKFNSGTLLNQMTSGLPDFQQVLTKKIVVDIFAQVMNTRLRGGCLGMTKDYRDIIYDNLEKDYEEQILASQMTVGRDEDINNIIILSNITDANILVRMQEDGSFNKFNPGAESSWFNSLSTANFEEVERAKKFFKESFGPLQEAKDLAVFKKNKTTLSMEIVDGLDDNFINLSPEKMIFFLTVEVMSKLSKYGLDKNVIKDVVEKNVKNPLIKIDEFIHAEEIKRNDTEPAISAPIETNALQIPVSNQGNKSATSKILSRIDGLRNQYGERLDSRPKLG